MSAPPPTQTVEYAAAPLGQPIGPPPPGYSGPPPAPPVACSPDGGPGSAYPAGPPNATPVYPQPAGPPNATPVYAAGLPTPPGAPIGGQWIQEKYCGTITWLVVILGYFLIACYSLLFLNCPLDERTVYIAPNGAKYNQMGIMV